MRHVRMLEGFHNVEVFSRCDLYYLISKHGSDDGGDFYSRPQTEREIDFHGYDVWGPLSQADSWTNLEDAEAECCLLWQPRIVWHTDDHWGDVRYLDGSHWRNFPPGGFQTLDQEETRYKWLEWCLVRK